MKKITDVFPELSSAEVDKIFKKFIGSSSAEATTEGGTEKYAGAKVEETKAPAKSNTKEDAKVSGTRSIDDAFGDMLADDAT